MPVIADGAVVGRHKLLVVVLQILHEAQTELLFIAGADRLAGLLTQLREYWE